MAYRQLPANRVGTRSAGGTITPAEVHDQYINPDDLACAKESMYSQLWQAYTLYEQNYFSGGAYSLILEMKLAGVPEARAVGDWILTHWGRYYVRKAAVAAMETPAAVRGTSLDCSDSGAPPYTVAQLMAIAAALNNQG